MDHVVPSPSLGEFLKARRARLSPEDVGLPPYGRRRTQGLRREEVAQLAHIGTSWYTSLEQGRDVHPSNDVLNNIAAALRLTEDERSHLHQLARHGEQALNVKEQQEPGTGLERIISALDPNPAFILGRSWDILLWNQAAEAVFRLPVFAKDMQPPLNWLRRFLTEPSLRANNKDWELKAQIMIARFRAEYARFPGDLGFMELTRELMQTSELFRLTWPRHDVQLVTDCHKHWCDPRIGEMEFEQVTLQPPTHPDLKMMIYTASPETAILLNNYCNHEKKQTGSFHR